jgi:hypothetical protein
LRPAGRLALSRKLDGTTVADPKLPEVLWSYRYRDGALYIARKAQGKVEECVADYAFGSGHSATTFVSVIDLAIPAILEHRLSYYANASALSLTPGHNSKRPPPGLSPLGSVPPPHAVRACFGCHSTQISARGDGRIDEATMIPNVSCERCHGPGRAHVTAARRGAPERELSLPFGPERWTAPGLLQFCGECHRHPAGPHPDQIRRDDPILARFQPIGLLMSKCYRESAGKFSCVTCHDPHARPSSDRAGYDATCLNCHGGPVEPAKSVKSIPTPGVVCPVSPRQGCVECHMPRVDLGQVFPSDHWIRVHKQDDAANTKRNVSPGSNSADRDER